MYKIKCFGHNGVDLYSGRSIVQVFKSIVTVYGTYEVTFPSKVVRCLSYSEMEDLCENGKPR